MLATFKISTARYVFYFASPQKYLPNKYLITHCGALTEKNNLLTCKTELWSSVCLKQKQLYAIWINWCSRFVCAMSGGWIMFLCKLKKTAAALNWFSSARFERRCCRVAETLPYPSFDFIHGLWSANKESLSSKQTGHCPSDVLLPAPCLWWLLPLHVQPSSAGLPSPRRAISIFFQGVSSNGEWLPTAAVLLFYERHGSKGLNLSSPSAATAVPSIPPELNIAAAGRACWSVRAYYMLGSIDFLLHRGATSAFINSSTRSCLLCRFSPLPPPLVPVTESSPVSPVLPRYHQEGIIVGFLLSPTETDLTVFDLISAAAILTWQSQEWRVKHKSVCAMMQCDSAQFHTSHRKIENVGGCEIFYCC